MNRFVTFATRQLGSYVSPRGTERKNKEPTLPKKRWPVSLRYQTQNSPARHLSAHGLHARENDYGNYIADG